MRGSGASTAGAQPRALARASWRDIPAPLRWLGALVVLIVAAVATFVSVFQWNWLRTPIGDYLSARMHRTVVIHGDLTAHIWSWTPSATAGDLTVGQPAWAGRGQMATIPRLTIAVDLKALLGGRLILPLVDAEHPTATLLRDASGRNNWTFTAPAVGPTPLKLPPIRHFTIDDGRLTLNDDRRHLRFAGVVSSNEQVSGYGHGRFTLTGRGTVNDTPFLAQVQGGPLINVDPDRPYPFVSDIRAGATHIAARGTILRPFDLGLMQAAGRVNGPDLADLYDLTGFTLPNTPPYDVTGRLDRNGSRFDIAGIRGRVGVSDISGHLVAQETGGRRDLTGELASRRLKLADLTAVIGGAPAKAIKGTLASPLQKAEAARLAAEHRILPDARLDVARMRQMDADVRYRADTVDAGPLPIREVAIHAKLDHGLLTLDPLSLVLPQGAISGHVRLDARGATPATSLDLAIARAQVQSLLPKVQGTAPVQGDLEAWARLDGAGDSVRAVAANVNGVVAVAIPQGQMRQLFAELMGVDIGRSLFLYLSHDQRPTPIRCAVAEFQAHDGVLTAQRILIDTAAVQATGKGVVDLRNETLNLAIAGEPKHFRLLRLAAPITISGRLDSPKVGVDVGKAAGQMAIGAVLGAVVSPLAVILPFIATGTPRDADCSALLAEAATHGAPVGHAR